MSEQRAAAEFTRATAVQVVGTTLSRVTGFGRVFALAYAIGFTRLSDAYNLANTVPNVIFELVLGGVLSATLVPVFVERLEHRDAGESGRKDADDPWHAISAVVTFALAVAVAVSVVLVLAAPLIVRLYTVFNTTGDVAAENAVATSLLRWFAPQVAFYGAITVTTALLLARRKFANPKFSPIANNVVVIAALLVLPHVVDDLSLDAVRHNNTALVLLGLGTTAGVAVQAILQAPGFRKVRLVWDPRHEAVRRVIRLSFWTFGVVVANQVALYVALALANRRPGEVTVYLAAYTFFILPHGVIAVSVMDSLLPELAARWSRGDVAAFQRRVVRGFVTISALVVPAAAGYIILARPVIGLTLEYGALHATSAGKTAATLALFAIGLPGFSAYLLLMRGFQAMQDTRSMFLLYALENAINVVLAIALHPSLGVEGLALSFGLAYTLAALVAWRRLAGALGGLPARPVVRTLARVSIATAVMAAAVLAASVAIGGDRNFHLVARVGVAVAVGVTVYIFVARALQIREVTALFAAVRRRANP